MATIRKIKTPEGYTHQLGSIADNILMNPPYSEDVNLTNWLSGLRMYFKQLAPSSNYEFTASTSPNFHAVLITNGVSVLRSVSLLFGASNGNISKTDILPNTNITFTTSTNKFKVANTSSTYTANVFLIVLRGYVN